MRSKQPRQWSPSKCARLGAMSVEMPVEKSGAAPRQVRSTHAQHPRFGGLVSLVAAVSRQRRRPTAARRPTHAMPDAGDGRCGDARRAGISPVAYRWVIDNESVPTSSPHASRARPRSSAAMASSITSSEWCSPRCRAGLPRPDQRRHRGRARARSCCSGDGLRRRRRWPPTNAIVHDVHRREPTADAVQRPRRRRLRRHLDGHRTVRSGSYLGARSAASRDALERHAPSPARGTSRSSMMFGGATPIMLNLISARVQLRMVDPGPGRSERDRQARSRRARSSSRSIPASSRARTRRSRPTARPRRHPLRLSQPSTGRSYLTLFDKSPKDCVISLDEIRNSTLIQSLLMPDVTVEGQNALSFGFGVTAVRLRSTQAARALARARARGARVRDRRRPPRRRRSTRRAGAKRTAGNRVAKGAVGRARASVRRWRPATRCGGAGHEVLLA